MGYLHIDNLYKNQRILLFKQCYALEKVHGTSTHLAWTWASSNPLRLFSGGEKPEAFAKVFDLPALEETFRKQFPETDLIVFGEGYGGRCQGMKDTYGGKLQFIGFDVKIGESWLCVPDAFEICATLGLEFVPYVIIPATIPAADAARDAYSVVAGRRGCGWNRAREGVVLRPTIELRSNNGERIIAKHKGEAFSEFIRTPRPIEATDLARPRLIADKWATSMRLEHVIDAVRATKGGEEPGLENTGEIIRLMIEDIVRESSGEDEIGPAERKAIGARSAQLYKKWLSLGLALYGNEETTEYEADVKLGHETV